MAKEKQTPTELVLSHKPKNFKYRFVIKDDALLKSLQEEGFDFDELDTIHDDELVHIAYKRNVSYMNEPLLGKQKNQQRLRMVLSYLRKW